MGTTRFRFGCSSRMKNGGAWCKRSDSVLPWRRLDNRERGDIRPCLRTHAQSTGQIVVSVEYRLAPEHRFPTGLEDCYAAAQAMLRGEILPEVTPENVTIMGDSAGGNLAAAVCLMARDKKELLPGKQILIYPAVNSCYTEKSPYKSVKTNGTGYLLTSVKMEDYVILYQRTEEDRKNPYFAPVLAENLQGLPDTLVLTAQYDPLRDEGEDYAKKLKRLAIWLNIIGSRVHCTAILRLALNTYMCRKVFSI